MRRRSLTWQSALADLRSDRAERRDIREERVSAAGVLAWRGKSGQRYIFSAYQIEDAPTDFADGYVEMGIVRDERGVGTVRAPNNVEAGFDRAGFRRHLARIGCTQIAIHRLAVTTAERIAVCCDLTEVAAPVDVAIAEPARPVRTAPALSVVGSAR